MFGLLFIVSVVEVLVVFVVCVVFVVLLYELNVMVIGSVMCVVWLFLFDVFLLLDWGEVIDKGMFN